MEHTIRQFCEDLERLGVRESDCVMIHSSYKSLGGIEDGAAGVFSGLSALLGDRGTMILPAFSYDTVDESNPVFDREKAPCCVGYLPEYFRTQVDGVVRSIHATHSCSVKGYLAQDLIEGHEEDLTPVGVHSPIAKLPHVHGKILFLGCSTHHNTSLHGVEETAEPPYLFDHKYSIDYRLIDGDRRIEQHALRHCFRKDGWFYEQKYGRITSLLSPEHCRYGKVLGADCCLMDAQEVWKKGHEALLRDPYFFVEKVKIEEG